MGEGKVIKRLPGLGVRVIGGRGRVCDGAISLIPFKRLSGIIVVRKAILRDSFQHD